jgi:hypothetical protein
MSRVVPCIDRISHVSSAFELPAPIVGPLQGVSVNLLDAHGSTFVATTNAAGNFYIDESAWQPIPPIHVTVSFGDVVTEMSTNIGRDGSCASCHVDPPTRISAGHIYVVPNPSLLTSSDGGT